jgi:cation transporter-like permease
MIIVILAAVAAVAGTVLEGKLSEWENRDI